MLSRAWRSVRSAVHLDARDRAFALRACALGAALPPLLRLVPLPVLVRGVAGRPSGADLPSPERMVALTDRVLRFGRGPWRPNCAVRSLVLLRYLRRRGEPAAVSFGVRKTGEALDGHAWVSLAGEPFAEALDPRPVYRVTFTWPDDP